MPPTVTDPAGRHGDAPARRSDHDVAIRTDGLTKYYGRRRRSRGVDGLDLEVRTGEVFGFLGPNGAGKTTTIRLLIDLIRPTRGSAAILGHDTRRDSTRARALVGYLPGDLALDPRTTGRRLVRDLTALSGGSDPAFAAELVERLDVDMDRRVGDLSKGNRQKLGIVQALAHRPPVLLLDEPTAGLDPLVQAEFERVAREAADGGQTVFLSSHVLSEVQRLADRVAVIRDGRVVAVDDVATLIGGSPRHVEITFAEPVDPAAFAAIPELHDLSVDGRFVRGTIRGSADALVKAAARYRVDVFDSHEPRLEEIFLDLYAGAPDPGPTRAQDAR